MCCVCAGTCNHVGPHSYCTAHGGVTAPVMTTTSTNTVWFDFTKPAQCVLCKQRPSHPAGALCDECLSWAQLPWWQRLHRRRPW